MSVSASLLSLCSEHLSFALSGPFAFLPQANGGYRASYMMSYMTNLDSVLKSRDITLPTKVCTVKPMVFPVVVYECESWTIKKAERQKTDAFELWCWKILESPLTVKKSK